MKGYEAAKVKLDKAISDIREMGFSLNLINQMYNEIMTDTALDKVIEDNEE